MNKKGVSKKLFSKQMEGLLRKLEEEFGFDREEELKKWKLKHGR